jgi:hypothetical protein
MLLWVSMHLNATNWWQQWPRILGSIWRRRIFLLLFIMWYRSTVVVWLCINFHDLLSGMWRHVFWHIWADVSEKHGLHRQFILNGEIFFPPETVAPIYRIKQRRIQSSLEAVLPIRRSPLFLSYIHGWVSRRVFIFQARHLFFAADSASHSGRRETSSTPPQQPKNSIVRL